MSGKKKHPRDVVEVRSSWALLCILIGVLRWGGVGVEGAWIHDGNKMILWLFMVFMGMAVHILIGY